MAEQDSILKLVMEKGPKEGETLEFRPGSVIRIGRVVRGNTIAIKDAGVSSKHLKIESKPGLWFVADLDSSNGTVLNGSELQSLTPSDLSDGDVKIEAHGGDSRLRRNPKRGTAKEEESGGEVIAENRSRRGRSKANLDSIGEDSALGLGIGGELGSTVGVGAENWGQRCGSKVNLDLIGEDSALGMRIGGELGSSVGVVAEKPRGRGKIVMKMTRGGMRRKKNLGGEPLECVVNKVLAEKEDVKESNLEREDYKMVEDNLMNREMEAVQAEEREDKDVKERGQTGDESLAASLGKKESGVELRLEMGLTWRRCPSGSGSIIWRYIWQNRYMRRLRR
ncbi:FHA domain-containing protein At4g14490-like [Actinidia eriantha]|uniref:FHA domain-containing protein At4g14490-like n=1 Tax=Actinidia eriantha TaxID=165200 RepID=UPI00258C2CCA|nr:FHA domain-containing protein At4g14490-like [Actinidia eriantha]